jgi:pimeloyl-ACP methyl ester carboxylesterase
VNTEDRVALDRLVDFGRRLPRSGPAVDRAWRVTHSAEVPALAGRALARAEGVADAALARLPRFRPELPESLVEREVEVGGIPVFYRASAVDVEGPVMIHVHGFGISGTYLLPTAGLLAAQYQTYVPDLPGYGRSGNAPSTLGIAELADAVAAFMDAIGVERATLVGNSLGSAISAQFAASHRDRVDRVVLVSPAGGLHSRPLGRAIGQMVADSSREPITLVGVAAPDYLRFGLIDSLRLFHAMTHFPVLERLLSLDVPALAVLGARDPLMPPERRIREVMGELAEEITIVRLEGVAHAANFSHPDLLAHVIREYMSDLPLTAYPGLPGAIRIARSVRAAGAS